MASRVKLLPQTYLEEPDEHAMDFCQESGCDDNKRKLNIA